MVNSRQKGAAGEREAAAFLSRLFKRTVRRGCQFKGAPDAPDVTGLPGLHVEVKRVQNLNIDTALEQSKRDAGEYNVPIVLHRRNGKPWKFTFYADDLLKFLDATETMVAEAHAEALAASHPLDWTDPIGRTEPEEEETL